MVPSRRIIAAVSHLSVDARRPCFWLRFAAGTTADRHQFNLLFVVSLRSFPNAMDFTFLFRTLICRGQFCFPSRERRKNGKGAKPSGQISSSYTIKIRNEATWLICWSRLWIIVISFDLFRDIASFHWNSSLIAVRCGRIIMRISFHLKDGWRSRWNLQWSRKVKISFKRYWSFLYMCTLWKIHLQEVFYIKSSFWKWNMNEISF